MKPFEVLLVEDSAGDALLMEEILAAISIPVKLHVARDGSQALLFLEDRTDEPDLVILDLNLPGLSGHDVLRRFHPQHARIVVFSSSADPKEREQALALGAQEFIQKPTTWKRILMPCGESSSAGRNRRAMPARDPLIKAAYFDSRSRVSFS